MKEDVNIQLMAAIINGITQTREWEAIQNSDPMVVAESVRLDNALSAIKDLVSKEQFNELTEAAVAFATASDYVAILFGMRTVYAIRDVSARSGDLSKFLLARMSGGANKCGEREAAT